MKEQRHSFGKLISSTLVCAFGTGFLLNGSSAGVCAGGVSIAGNEENLSTGHKNPGIDSSLGDNSASGEEKESTSYEEKAESILPADEQATSGKENLGKSLKMQGENSSKTSSVGSLSPSNLVKAAVIAPSVGVLNAFLKHTLGSKDEAESEPKEEKPEEPEDPDPKPPKPKPDDDDQPKDTKKQVSLIKIAAIPLGIVVSWFVLHCVAKSLVFFGIYFSKSTKPKFYNDIEEIHPEGHDETTFTIAYKNEDEKNKAENRDTIILSFGGAGTNGRNMINCLRTDGKWIFGKVTGDGKYEECSHVGEGVCTHGCKYLYVNRKLDYTVASIKPRGYHSSENFFKKLYISGEDVNYEDAERLYDYVTGKLGYKNVIINSFCQGCPTAAHLVKYAEKKAKKKSEKSKVIGLILDGLMNGIYGFVKNGVTYNFLRGGVLGRILGPVAGFICKFFMPFTGLNTYENLKDIDNKNLPILCLSGGEKDLLSLEKTGINKKLRDNDFTDVTTIIKNQAGHVPIFLTNFIKVVKDENQAKMVTNENTINELLETKIEEKGKNIGKPAYKIIDMNGEKTKPKEKSIFDDGSDGDIIDNCNEKSEEDNTTNKEIITVKEFKEKAKDLESGQKIDFMKLQIGTLSKNQLN